MIRSVLLAGVALVGLAACSQTSTRPAAVATVAPPAKPQIGTFGFDTTGMDKSVRPGDDFAEYTTGTWRKTTPIPADRAGAGDDFRLDDLSKARTRSIIEEASATQAAPGSNAQKVGDFYASFMDEAAIEAKGLDPLQTDLARVAMIKTKRDVARVMGEDDQRGIPSPFGTYIDQDAKAPDSYIVTIVQGGLGLPDRDYYLQDNPKFVETREKYQAHAARMLALAGVPEKWQPRKAKAIYDFEKKLAQVQWSQVDSREVDKTYNKWTPADFAAKAPGFDWKSYFDAAGIGGQGALIAAQPTAFAGEARLIAATPLGTLKDYLLFRAIKARAPVLTKAFVDENFAFNGTVLSGTPQIRPRWQRGVNAVTAAMGEAVGQLYVAKYFPPETKAQADKLVRNLIAAMDGRLAKLEWMAPATKATARRKLAAFTPKIGYPDHWRDYSALTVIRGDAYGNAERAALFETQRNLAKLGRPVDRSEWQMTPMEVNAYANPTMNEVVFPAAILQPPYFDPYADPAVNYGSIGAVIGHEISHHFDDQGRKFDSTGKLADWWTPDDVSRFKAYTDALVAQYNAYEAAPGVHVNGALTLGENIADLAGLAVAYDAYRISLNGKEPPVIDGFTGDQRFFLAYGGSWRVKYRPELVQQLVVSDPHTPAFLRPNVVRNIDAWYPAFGVAPTDKLALPKDKRVQPW